MKFKQSESLKSCISLNIKSRINSKSENNMNKLLDNSIFGKTIQNKRKQRNAAYYKWKYKKYSCFSVSFEGVKHISHNLKMYHMSSKKANRLCH